MKVIILLLLFIAPVFGQLRAEENFRKVYSKGRLAEKRALMRSFTKEERDEVWKLNFAWGKAKLDLNQEQKDYTDRLTNKLSTITNEERDQFQDEAIQIFPKFKSFLMFGSIGPYTDVPCMPFQRIVMGNCPCSVGSYFNMSCDKPCGAAGGQCTQTPDGCGFLGGYACDGYCQSGYIPEDPPQG